MTRDEINDRIKKLKYKAILLNHPTGTGKTRSALTKSGEKNLIVYFETSHKNNILDDIRKHGIDETKYTFTTYKSIHKHVGNWDLIICDEAHHITEKSAVSLKKMNYKNIVYLTADIGKKQYLLEEITPGYYTDVITLQEAVEGGLLPMPNIQIHWTTMGNKRDKEYFHAINPKYTKRITYDQWEKENKFNVELIVTCSEAEMYSIIQGEYKQLERKREEFKSLYEEFRDYHYLEQYRKFQKLTMYKGLIRKRTISSFKSKPAAELFKELEGKKLFFTESIEEAKQFKHNVHSKNITKKDEETISDFKAGVINELVCVRKLQESHNIPNLVHVVLQQVDFGSILKFIQIRGRAMRDEGSTLHILFVKDTIDEQIYKEGVKNKLW